VGVYFFWLTLGCMYTKPDRPARSRAKTACPGDVYNGATLHVRVQYGVQGTMYVLLLISI
jgi:hypothetical protein